MDDGVSSYGGRCWPSGAVDKMWCDEWADDVHVPRGAACQKISQILGRVVHDTGEFSFEGAADALPVLPGLAVKEFGGVSLPLRNVQAETLVQHCRQKQEQVWSLTPDQVEMTNPQWAIEIRELCKQSTSRLGFKEGALQPVLSKLLLYGAGAEFGWEKEEEDSGRVVAHLVVQLPSEFIGGDFLVVDAGTQKLSRYELGNVDMAAAYKPHCVVYAAGAHHCVDEVESGFRLMAVYSLCLPSEFPASTAKRLIDVLRAQLVEAMETLEGQVDAAAEDEITRPDEKGKTEDARIALLLSETYKTAQIQGVGVNALSGMDRDRFNCCGMQTLAFLNKKG